MEFIENKKSKEELNESVNKNENKVSKNAILDSNDINLIVKYAKENKDKDAINRVRELLEESREIGEKVVQNFLDSFKELEERKHNYSDFQNTKSGKVATSLLEKMPEPFKSEGYKKLEKFKEELKYRSDFFEKNKNDPQKIWKEVFGFDYYNVPDFKERFKTFLFKKIKGISKNYYKDKNLKVVTDPFSINFFVEDQDNFKKAYEENGDVYQGSQGVSFKKKNIGINMINTENTINDKSDFTETLLHEKEHSVHTVTNPFSTFIAEDSVLGVGFDFKHDLEILNHSFKFDLEERLKLAKDEIFAFLKGGESDRSYVKDVLLNDYDHSKTIRFLNIKDVDNSTYLSGEEKIKLREGIDFMQSEYARVLKNMVDLIYEGNKSVEFFRNVPINELWKYSDGKYKRTDFIIRDYRI